MVAWQTVYIHVLTLERKMSIASSFANRDGWSVRVTLVFISHFSSTHLNRTVIGSATVIESLSLKCMTE